MNREYQLQLHKKLRSGSPNKRVLTLERQELWVVVFFSFIIFSCIFPVCFSIVIFSF